jgi:hypothetical protein
LEFATDEFVIKFTEGMGFHKILEERIRTAVMLIDCVTGVELDEECKTVETYSGDGS